MSRPDEGLIHTWLDGELDAAEAARVEALVKSDPEWAAAAAEARGLIAASARIVGALDDVPANVVPVSKPVVTPVAAAASVRPVRRTMPTWLRAAAAIVVVVGSLTVLSKSSGPELQPVVESKDETLPPARATASDSLAFADRAANAPAAGARETDAKQRPNALADAAGKTAAQERSAAAPPVVQIQQQPIQQQPIQQPTQQQLQVGVRQQSQMAGAGAAASGPPALARADAVEQRKTQADSLGALKKEDQKFAAAAAAPAIAGRSATARDAGATGNRVLPETKVLTGQVVTTGSADARREFVASEAVPVGTPLCYQERRGPRGDGLLHRVVRISDTTAIAPEPGSTSGGSTFNRRARDAALTRTTYRLSGDTLFVPLATGETRVAIKTPCP